MKILVCIKQVPDSAQIRVHPVTNTIMRQGVPTIINPYDLFSLEEALRLRDKFGGEVTVLTMGPPMASDSLRKALAIGADRAVLLTDRFFAGSDTLATTYALAQAIRKIEQTFGEQDIVFTGKQTIDGDTAQVGPGVAKRLDLLQLTYVSKIVEVRSGESARSSSSAAPKAACRCSRRRLPCLITMLEGTNEVRRGAIRGLAARGARRDRHLEREGRGDRGPHEMRPEGLADDREEGLRAAAALRKGRLRRAGEDGAGSPPKRCIAAIFARHPALEDDMTKLASGF